jgi:integrase
MLTTIAIEKLPIPAKRREVPDEKITGLYLVVQPSGAKSWALRYRFSGKPAKLTIGGYPEVDLRTARQRAQEALGALAAGKDPAGAKRAAKEAQKATTDLVEAVAAIFLERHVKRNVGASWGREVERLLKVEVLPQIGAKRIGDVTRADIHSLLDTMADRAPVNANRLLAMLRRMFNWAVERGYIEHSPCDKVKAPGGKETARDRVLSPEEIGFVWNALDTVGWPFGRIGQLCLLTGARRDEIGEARWSEIDLAAKTLTIAKERSKNGIAHEIPLSDAAIRIIEALPRIESRADYVFTVTARAPVAGWSRAKEAIDKAVGAAIPKWVIHDLRRTAASGMAELKFPPHVVEAVLNHKSGTIRGVAAVYNRYSYATEKRAAIDAWGRRLDEIITGVETPSNVVELKARG